MRPPGGSHLRSGRKVPTFQIKQAASLPRVSTDTMRRRAEQGQAETTTDDQPPLKVLHEAGLVDRDKRGLWVYYRIRPQAPASLGTLIADPR